MPPLLPLALPPLFRDPNWPKEWSDEDFVPQPSYIFVKGRETWYCGVNVTNHPRFCRRNFGRGPSQPRSNPMNPPSSSGNASSPSAYGSSSLAPPNIPASPASPSLATTTMQTNEQAHQTNQRPRNVPFFFREDYVGFIVKGNFMTLAAKPLNVEEGEWLSHQIVEQNRLLSGMLKMVQADDGHKGPMCNEKTCPTMAAGDITYPWIDTNRNPINIPAPTYIKHIQTWISGKIQNEAIFPTGTFQTAPQIPTQQQAANDPNHWLGKASGFPQSFENELKNMYKQMFRCYAHLYFAHWLFFWEVNATQNLNTCFVHFVNVGRTFNLLSDKDTEPMQPLIDIWIRRGDLPQLENASGTAPVSVATPATATSSNAGTSGSASTIAPPASAGAASGPTT